ncbi:diguanylate cyclase domain-containing protein [uncultured Cohaesibacter sp.]|uniref:diguanylate cyclase domain-containing protein n=1 Tax=uncultured Cohaesibacter sp. TaxID=1002546 RepID=UPI0029C6BD33|nr:diguanylate cyclase [uncultured Cohaesibacter sp.]
MAKQTLIFTHQDCGLDVPVWAEMLAEANFACWAHCVHSEDKPDDVSLKADILMLDLLDVPQESIRDVVAKAASLRESLGFAEARVPMIAVAHPSVQFDEDMLRPFSDVIKPPLTMELIANRLISLMRLATMRREAERRSQTFRRFGVGLPVVPPPRLMEKQELLYLGPGMALLPIQTALPQDIEIVAALSPSMALHYLDNNPFDALIVELRDYNEHLVQFIGDLRRNSNYFSFPIIVVCHKRATEDGLAALAAGANDIVSFPFSERFFENRIEILVREERYRRQLRKIFTEARLLMPTDEITRLYSEEFLKAHLGVLSEQDGAVAMSFAGIDVSFDEPDGSRNDKPDASLLARVGRFISSLMRAEDMLTRLDNGRFVAFFPDTDLFEARIALQRIRSIVQLSPFVQENATYGVNVTLDFSLHHCDTRQADFDPERILRDLFENPVIRF